MKDVIDEISLPKISIIIPCQAVDDYVKDCIHHCLTLDYPNYEILLLPDSSIEYIFPKVTIISTGVVKPSIKRNIGISKSQGEICAFIDSDAFPTKDWIKNAVRCFEKKDVGAVGGPNLTPMEDSLMQKASSIILSSSIGAGKFSFRYSIKEEQEVDELPSCNLFVRKSILKEINGLDPSFLTAEDAKLCFQINHDLGKKVLYVPDVIVYHHRRPLFIPHLKQIWVYGRDKAFLFKKFPAFRRTFYFLPSIFVLGLLIGMIMCLFNPLFRAIYVSILLLYIFLALITGIKTKSLRMAPLVFIGIVLTHVTYGVGFLKGLLTKEMK